MSDLLFDAPWWIPALLIIVGICLFFNGNKLQVARLKNGGLAAIGLAIAWIVLGIFVDTGKKFVRRETRNFVQYAVDRDWPKFKAELSPSAVFVLGVPLPGADKITADVTTGVETIQLKGARVQKLVVEQTGSDITANFEVISQQDNFKPICNSVWRFDWEESGQGWKIHEIRCVELDGKSMAELGDMNIKSVMH